jgi:hypothetical protein
VPLEAFHFSFKAHNTWRRDLRVETYIYANLDRRATFTLLNCRLSAGEKKAKDVEHNENWKT